MDWQDDVETLLSEIADEASLRAKLHSRQHTSYKGCNQCFHIPVVVLSVLSGSASFISESYSDLTRKYMVLGIGGISIFVSIVSAVGSYLKLAELSESNHIASLQWSKLYSKIKFCLYLQRENRETCHDFMHTVFTEHERLNEISPILLDKQVKKVRSKLKKRALDNGFVLPFNFNGFQHMRPYNEQFEDNEEDEKV